MKNGEEQQQLLLTDINDSFMLQKAISWQNQKNLNVPFRFYLKISIDFMQELIKI